MRDKPYKRGSIHHKYVMDGETILEVQFSGGISAPQLNMFQYATIEILDTLYGYRKPSLAIQLTKGCAWQVDYVYTIELERP